MKAEGAASDRSYLAVHAFGARVRESSGDVSNNAVEMGPYGSRYFGEWRQPGVADPRHPFEQLPLGDVGLTSIDHLETPILVVMGHTKCGAVTAVATGAEVHGHIPELVDNISPAVESAKKKNPSLSAKAVVEPAIKENVFQAISDVITKSPSVRKRLKEGKVKIVGALYHLEDGSVEWLGEHPEEKELIAKGDAAPPETHAKSHTPGDDSAVPPAAHSAEANATGEAHAAEAPAEEHEAVAPKPARPNPLSFAIVAAIACLAGAISMKLSSRE